MSTRSLQSAPSQGSASLPGAGYRPSAAVQLVSDVAEWMALRDAWNALAASVARASVFLQHEWFDAAWQWRQQTARLHLLCLFRERELTAVLPLVRERIVRCGLALRELSFLTVP